MVADERRARGDTSAKVSLKEAQRQLTRRRLLEAAEETFREKGFSFTTLEDIASTAGVNRGTIYLHYPNKAQILLALLAEKEVDFAIGYDRLLHASSHKELQRLLGDTIEWWAVNHSLLTVLMREAAAIDDDVREFMINQREGHIAGIAAVLESHGLPPGVARARAFVFSSAWVEVTCRLYSKEVDLTPVALRNALVDLFDLASIPPGSTSGGRR